MGKIIFYHPIDLVLNGVKGSEIRPVEMLHGLKENFSDVSNISGQSWDRKEKIKDLISKIKSGERFDFLYGETVNMPFFISDRDHVPRSFWWDIRLFMICSSYGIPIGVFYRDVYWREKELKKKVKNIFKRYLKILLHWFEWLVLCRYVDILFLPSLEVGTYLPQIIRPLRYVELGPGFKPSETNVRDYVLRPTLDLFYVGGVIPPYYDMHPLFSFVNSNDYLKLTVCTRRDEWNEVKSLYSNYLNDRIVVVHKSSQELDQHYAVADIILELRAPNGYFKNAFPIKIVEAIGKGVPVICFDGSRAARFIRENGFGYVVKDYDDLAKLISRMHSGELSLDTTRKNIVEFNRNFTWSSKAQQVARFLKHG